MLTACVGCKATTAFSTCKWRNRTNYMREVLITMTMRGRMYVRGAGMGYSKAWLHVLIYVNTCIFHTHAFVYVCESKDACICSPKLLRTVGLCERRRWHRPPSTRTRITYCFRRRRNAQSVFESTCLVKRCAQTQKKQTAKRSPRNPRGNDTHTNAPPQTRRKEFQMENGARVQTHKRPNRPQRNPHGSDTCTNAPFRHRKNPEGPSCAPEAATTTCWQKTVADPPPRATESRPPPAAATPIIALQRYRVSSH